MASRRGRFVDTKDVLIVPLSKMRQDVTDVYSVASGWYYTDPSNMEKLLKEERQANRDYDQAWKKAEVIYQQRKRDIDATEATKHLGETFHKAVIVYTLEDPPVYKDFNKRSRGLTEDAWEQFPYKSLWFMLSTALPSLKSDPALSKGTVLYRGVSFHFSGMRGMSPGDIVMFKSFASTTTSEEVARGFLGDTGTLIELRDRPMAGSGIRKHSKYPDEDEVLVCPWSSYGVKDHIRSGRIHRLVLQTQGPLSGSLPYNYNFGR